MALSYSTLGAFPRLLNYAEASKYEERIKPIRGRPDVIKPLGKRNQPYRRIHRTEEGDIQIIMWGDTPMITYCENGDVLIRPCHWQSQRAVETEMLHRLLCVRGDSFDGNLWIYNRETGHYRPMLTEGDTVLRESKNGCGLVPVNLPMPVVHKVNRKGTNAVRRRYQAFIDYAKGMDQLDIRMDLDGIREALNQPEAAWPKPPVAPPGNWWGKDTLTPAMELSRLMLSESPADHFLAYLCFTNPYTFNENSWAYKRDKGIKLAPVTQEAMNKVLFRVHYSECLKLEQVDSGKLVKDAYKWAEPTT